MSRRTGKCETTEYAGMVRRMIRGYGKRVGQADDADLAGLVQARAQVEDAITDAVHTMRERGLSWAYIAQGLGTSRQYAQRTYGTRADRLADIRSCVDKDCMRLHLDGLHSEDVKAP